MTKVISLSEAAYEEMKALKQGDESFSDVVHRLAEKIRRKPLTAFFGAWPGTTAEAEHTKKMLERDRKRFKTREAKF
jgi:predicted CopG family antitoxin